MRERLPNQGAVEGSAQVSGIPTSGQLLTLGIASWLDVNTEGPVIYGEWTNGHQTGCHQ